MDTAVQAGYLIIMLACTRFRGLPLDLLREFCRRLPGLAGLLVSFLHIFASFLLLLLASLDVQLSLFVWVRGVQLPRACRRLLPEASSRSAARSLQACPPSPIGSRRAVHLLVVGRLLFASPHRSLIE